MKVYVCYERKSYLKTENKKVTASLEEAEEWMKSMETLRFYEEFELNIDNQILKELTSLREDVNKLIENNQGGKRYGRTA